jgi:hypothetical protein
MRDMQAYFEYQSTLSMRFEMKPYSKRGFCGLALILIVFFSPAYAIEAGDVFLTGNGPGRTAISVGRTDRDTFEITAQVLAVNAREFCDRYSGEKREKCVEDTKSFKREKFIVNCRTRTIITEYGSFRPNKQGGPWVSVADTNSIMQGGELFRMTCRKPH